MKYYIIPKHNFEETVDATTADEAIERFATTMEMDMNIYFDVVSEEEYLSYKLRRNETENKQHYIDFARSILEKDFREEHDLYDDDIDDIAVVAWNYHCGDWRGADGYTDYECVQKAVDYWEMHY